MPRDIMRSTKEERDEGTETDAGREAEEVADAGEDVAASSLTAEDSRGAEAETVTSLDSLFLRENELDEEEIGQAEVVNDWIVPYPVPEEFVAYARK